MCTNAYLFIYLFRVTLARSLRMCTWYRLKVGRRDAWEAQGRASCVPGCVGRRSGSAGRGGLWSERRAYLLQLELNTNNCKLYLDTYYSAVHCCGQQESLKASVEYLLPQLLYLLMQLACSSLAVPDFNLAEWLYKLLFLNKFLLVCRSVFSLQVLLQSHTSQEKIQTTLYIFVLQSHCVLYIFALLRHPYHTLVSWPAHARLPARNGLVNEVEFLGFITRKR